MPPRRRRRDSPAASPSPAPESDAPSASPSADSYHDEAEPPRFFNTTFTTYRVSPLYVGKQALTAARLQILSRRLRDALVGDVVRGVQVGLVEGDAAALGRTGALEAVQWRWVDSTRILGRDQRGSVELGSHDDEDDVGNKKNGKGPRVLCIELRYENARFTAILMPVLDKSQDLLDPTYQPSWTWQQRDSGGLDPSAFVHLPLLLFRMPAPLKSLLVDFLSTTFDCRVSPLALGTRTLVGSWEAWLSDSRHAQSKDTLFTLGFHIEPLEPKPNRPGEDDDIRGGGSEVQGQKPEPSQLGLKTIDIAIPAAEVHRFLHLGGTILDEPQTKKRKAGAATALSDEQQSRRRRKLAGGKDEEGWAWRGQSPHDRNGEREAEEETEMVDQPFTEALAAYVWHHLGLDMFHPGVRVLRVACDGFALSEGRLKVFVPAGGSTGAVWKLVRDLGRKARGKPGWGSNNTAIRIVIPN
ncbi:kinetochore complex Sim4 subunit Fta1-domain-containing protein [Hypoxylon fuscum]|nr:kinetochore complex Sim4 subunit Fta1-domain-containing protein [Hypoxylon fuscum]